MVQTDKKEIKTDPLDEVIKRTKEAQRKFAEFSQEKVDEIFRHAALVANSNRIRLAKIAVEETRMGIMEDKVIKNHFASEFIYNCYKDVKTCGVVDNDITFGLKKVAEPIGIIAGIVPTTNPTSTAIFKSLIALKTRNGIIFSPHPRAKNCTIATAKLILDAAVQAGAPEDIIGWIEDPTVERSNYLMHHPDINLILATGGPGMVKAAYSSGKPALGVGAGNTPAVIDETADIRMAVNSVIVSKTFDNGVICASEQSLVVVAAKYDEVVTELTARGGYILNKDQRKKVAHTMFVNGKLNAEIVGQTALKIAKMAGIEVPADTKILIGETQTIEISEPFANEKLSPILALYKAPDFNDAVDQAIRLVTLGGIGHTSVLYTDPQNKDRVSYFQDKMKTGRVLINMPSSHGAIGDIYNFKLEPSLTLGCGSWGGNSVSENVGVKHLINLKTVAERRENMLWFRVPQKIYFKYGSLPVALEDLTGKKRAVIITDKPLFDLGITDKVTNILDQMKIEYEIFYEVEPDPTLATVQKGMAIMNVFKPDVIIALGGGSPMDAAKIMWLMYENPESKFEGLALRFMDIRKRIYTFPKLGRKSVMVAIPTTSGTGSEVTPFAVITDEKTGYKYPLADYELTPDMAIIDPELVISMPPRLTAYSGIDAITHAIEAYVSVFSTEFTSGIAVEALKNLFKYLPASYKNGSKDIEAKEKVHYAATMAGMAFANAFLGICHSLAHKMGAEFHIPHGLANALLINQVIRFNQTNNPNKLTAFPQYKFPMSEERYAELATALGLKGKTNSDKVDALIHAITEMKKQLDIPLSIADAGVDKKDFEAKVDELAELAFDDQCTGANPRYPFIEELKGIYRNAYEGIDK